jgi:hypothetical protein
MSKLSELVGRLAEKVSAHETRLNALATKAAEHDALVARVAALEAQLAKVTSLDHAGSVQIRDEPTIALAEYRRQLDDVAFAPEADGVTSAMRAEHLAAVDAADRGASWLGRFGEAGRDKEIYAAIGAGRKALIRLAAMRERRPVPMELLSEKELSGYRNAKSDVHTEDRFRWEGTGNAEFLLDRPEFGKPVLVEVVVAGKFESNVEVEQVQRTDRTLRVVDTDRLHTWESRSRHLLVDPEATHLRLTADSSWRVRIVQPDELPPIELETTGQGEACFRHTLGGKKVTVQGTEGGSMIFIPDCDCADTCTDHKHSHLDVYGWRRSGAFREDTTLPVGAGVLYMAMEKKSVWSITVLDD